MSRAPTVARPRPGEYYPQLPDKNVPDTEKPVSHEYLQNQMALVRSELATIRRKLHDESRPFDFYRPSAGNESAVQINAQPTYVTELVRTIIVNGPTGGFGSYNGHGSVATPAANTIIASSNTVTVSGFYTVAWTVGIEVAVASAADNFGLFFGGASQEQSENGTAIADYPQQSLVLYIAAGNTVVVRSGAATETTATYSATISVTPYQGGVPFSLTLGGRVWNLQLPPSGILTIEAKPGIQLDQEDPRQLNSSIAGNWQLELIGWADSGSVVGV